MNSQQPASPAPLSPSSPKSTSRISANERLVRIGLVVVVALGIIGAAWFVSGKDGLHLIGGGGVNAQLLPKVGDQAPALVTYDSKGNLVHLSDFKGQPVWLNFWGSWCPPCRSEMPDIVAAYDKLQPKGVVMLAVSMQEAPQTAQQYADLNHATFRVLADPNIFDPREFPPEIADSAGNYQIRNFPTHIFIDRDGIVRAVVLEPLDEQAALKYGDMILAQK